MSKPPIDVEHYPELLEDYYPNFVPNPKIHENGIRLMQRYFAPEEGVNYVDDSDRERVKQHLEIGGMVIIAANHSGLSDQFALAGLLTDPSFAEINDKLNVRMPAKKSVVKYLRPIVENVGAEVVFRGKDYKKAGFSREQTEEYKQLFYGHEATMLIRGLHRAMFPQATRNTEDPKHATNVKDGLAEIANKYFEKDPQNGLLLVPVGLAFRRNLGQIGLKPSTTVGSLIDPSNMKKSRVTELFTENLQAAMNESLALAA